MNGACSVQWHLFQWQIYSDSDSLQAADQSMPDLQMTFSPLWNEPDPLELRGSGCFIVIKPQPISHHVWLPIPYVTPWQSSCVTIVLLVVLLSLRYGCRDPNYMVNVIRCAVLDLRTTNGNLYLDFLERLRGWQNNGTDMEMSSEKFQSLVLHVNGCNDASVLLGHC